MIDLKGLKGSDREKVKKFHFERGCLDGSITMIKVKVSSTLAMKEIIGDGDVWLSGKNSTIGGLLNELSKTHGEHFSRRIINPKTGCVYAYWIVVNERHCTELKHRLEDGDEVFLYKAWPGK
jgi:molybdopterin converting factor small subunit